MMTEQSSGSARIAHWFSSDAAFSELYPETISRLARRHWTPLLIAQKAAGFLRTGSGVKILDIGSGSGKFCLAAGYYFPDIEFIGIEQRAYLVEYANTALEKLGLQNVRFIHGNFTSLSFKDYNHFYFYNSFYENLSETEKIDQEIDYSKELFDHYSYQLYRQLKSVKRSTRLVTYHSLETEVPEAYQIVRTDVNDLLKCWIKI